MTEEHKKFVAKTIRELYFYPYRSKGENIVRLATWMASWIVGIVAQQTAGRRALGGAYFIYSISLLLEFIPEKRTNLIAKVTHGLFCIFLIFIFLGALFMIFGNSCTKNLQEPYKFLAEKPPFFGWIIFVMMLIGLVLVLMEAHKYFYDEEAEQQLEDELKWESIRKQFSDNLNGTSKGDNT